MNWFWDYGHLSAPVAYGPDTTYVAAARFLGAGAVEDWGCGSGYARKFFPQGYVGIDAAPGFADVVVDLREYRSRCDGILLRHVLEHNFEWEKILGNALASARKLVIVTFTPFGDETLALGWAENERGRVPDLSFRKEDLTRFFPRFTEQVFNTGLLYNAETLFCVENDYACIAAEAGV